MSSLTLCPLWAVRLSITTTCPGCRRGARACSTYASKTALVVAPSTAKDGPIPESVMLESRVTFFPQLRGAEQCARSPLGDQAYSGCSETFVEHSSTNTKRSACVVSTTIARQTALRNSSRSLAPTDLFSAPSHTPEHPRDGGIAHPYSRHTRQKLAPLRERRRRALFEVRFQELPRRFVELRFGAWALLRSERLSFACGGGVALDGRGAHAAEGLCDLSGGRAPFFGFDDLLPQVQRVGVHVGILPYRPTTLQDALGVCEV